MRLTSVSIALSLVLAAACQKDEPAAPTPTPTPTPAPAPAPAPAKAVPLAEAGPFDVADAIKPAGWKFEKSGGMGMGSLKTTTITATREGTTATITLVQPTGKEDDPKASVRPTPVADQLAGFQEKGAAFSDGTSLIAVEIPGDPAAAAALLAAAIESLGLKAP
jgi:hypothetical protein